MRTGGSLQHALARNHTLRPLLAFVQALTVPDGVYLTPEEFPLDGRLALVGSTRRLTRATRAGA